MRPNPLAPWELRIDDLRVYYEVDVQQHLVHIRAVGIKVRHQVKIAGEVID